MGLFGVSNVLPAPSSLCSQHRIALLRLISATWSNGIFCFTLKVPLRVISKAENCSHFRVVSFVFWLLHSRAISIRPVNDLTDSSGDDLFKGTFRITKNHAVCWGIEASVFSVPTLVKTTFVRFASRQGAKLCRSNFSNLRNGPWHLRSATVWKWMSQEKSRECLENYP